jgi:osmoprotectant transport system permease protein
MSNLIYLILELIVLVLIATAAAVLVGVAFGIFALLVQSPQHADPLGGGHHPDHPVLALLAMLMILFGLGNTTLVIGLLLFSLLPIIRNTLIALTGVESHIKDADRGMGMSKWQMLFKVELPLAFPMIFSGIRIAAVTNLSIAVIGVLIGSGGLGYPIYRGIQTRNTGQIFMGAVPVVLMALLFDFGMTKMERKLIKRAKT